MELAEKVPTALHVDHYAQIVHEKALFRLLIDNARNLIRDAGSSQLPASEMLDKAQEQFFSVGQNRARREAYTAGELMHGAVETLEQLAKSGRMITGVPTGYTELDMMTAGFHPGQLIIIAARPGMGKTALVLNMAEHMAVDNNIPVVFFSLEMSHQELALRLLCSRAKLNMRELRKGYMARDNWPRITTTASQIGEAPLHLDFSTSPTIMEIRSAARRYTHEFTRRGMKLGCIIIDYLQLMRGGGGKLENRQQEIAEISRSLKGLARELNIPVVALAQFNRRPDEREGRPQLSDLRESGAIEQDADVVMAIYREGMYKRDDPDLKTSAKIFVLKQRNGPVGDVPLQFFEEWTRFENPEREYSAVPN